jgi:hypothetical protein
MVAGLTLAGLRLASPRRRAAALALVVAVVLLHALVTRHVLQRMAEFATPAAMPLRIQVTYVRELELAPPPVVAPVVAPPAPRQRRASAAPVPAASAASAAAAPAAEAVAQAEAGPEPVPLAPPEPIPPPVAEAAPAPESAVAAAAPPAEAEAFDWPVSTRLTYALTGNYRGEINGDAQVEWVRVGTRYQVHIDVSLGPLISRRMSSQGELVGDRLLPARYDERRAC